MRVARIILTPVHNKRARMSFVNKEHCTITPGDGQHILFANDRIHQRHIDRAFASLGGGGGLRRGLRPQHIAHNIHEDTRTERHTALCA